MTNKSIWRLCCWQNGEGIVTGFPAAAARDFSRPQSFQTGCGVHLEFCSVVARRKAKDHEAEHSAHPIASLGIRGALSPLACKPSWRVG